MERKTKRRKKVRSEMSEFSTSVDGGVDVSGDECGDEWR